jgi:hypothetical protein
METSNVLDHRPHWQWQHSHAIKGSDDDKGDASRLW